VSIINSQEEYCYPLGYYSTVYQAEICYLEPKFYLARHVETRHDSLDTFDMSSPRILAVSSLLNSTARLARHDELDWLDALNTSSSTGWTRRE